MQGVRIAGVGIDLPPRIVTNDDLAKAYLEARQRVLDAGYELTAEQREAYETNDEWIQSRTGIKTRRFAEAHETTSDYAQRAAHAAWTDAYGEGVEYLPDFVLIGTVLGDHKTTPPTVVVTTRKMGLPAYVKRSGELHLRNCGMADIAFACSTPIAALNIALSFIQSENYKRGILILADLMSRTTGQHDRGRSPRVILGDAAAAYVLEACEASASWFHSPPVFMGGDGGVNGCNEDKIKTLADGAAVPLEAQHMDPRRDDHLMFMDGKAVLKDIVPLVANLLIPDMLEFFHASIEDINIIIPHQANSRMSVGVLERIAKRYPHVDFRLATYDNPRGVSVGQGSAPKTHTILWYDNIDHFGNTTSPATALCTYEARELGLIQPGTCIMQIAFGGGYSWGGLVFTWGT